MTTEEKLNNIQEKWTTDITELNTKMKTITSINELLNTIYSKRQECNEYLHNLMFILARLQRDYNKNKSLQYNKLKMGENGLRYTNDTAIYNQIDANLIEDKQMIDNMICHIDYMRESMKTIDNMIFGVNQKIKLHELLNGQ